MNSEPQQLPGVRDERLSPQDEIELVLRLIREVVNNRDIGLVDELIHPDFFDHAVAASRAIGPGGFRATVVAMHRAFAGLRMDPRDVIAADGKVVVRATVSGRHVDDLDDVPATGREWSMQQIDIFRLAGAQIIEHWASHDGLTAIRRTLETHQSDTKQVVNTRTRTGRDE